MPGRGESRYPPDWLKKGREDLERVERRLEESDLQDAAFHLQQALEKCLKAYLLSKGWRLKHIHDLRALLEEAIEFEPELERFLSLCREVTSYYMLERYPFFEKPPKREEIKRNLATARNLIDRLESDMGR